MPFTFAHPAAVLPLAKAPRWLLVPSALAVGSMSPDFWYLLPGLGFGRDSGHNLPGILRFCLPGSLLVWLGWRLVIGPALGRLCPSPVRAALRGRAHRFRGSNLWAVPLSIVAGAATHVAWDRIAHDNHVELIGHPDGQVQLLGHTTQMWQVLQVGSTALGMAILGLWFLLALRRLAPEASWGRRLWPGFPRALLVALLFLGPLAGAEHLHPVTDLSLHDLRAQLHPLLGSYLPLLFATLLTWGLLSLIQRLAREADRRG